MRKIYKIGTRGSLLAVTQCTLIAEEMSKRTGAKFELVKIKTQGDSQTDKPLWQLDGKDFFTKELDQALLANEVDLVVHSYKDLGSDRPAGIKLAAITKRKYANDVLLVKKDTIPEIEKLSLFNVGTSSPRRTVNSESSLRDLLPGTNDLKVQCSMLRGNINTRIQKLIDGEYDGIILALAGLQRLAQKKDSYEVLKDLLSKLNFMVMPQKIFPSSASQGALAIEYNSRNNDQDLYSVLQSVHCDKTEREVSNERETFKSYGGGCHLAVGIHTQLHKGLLLEIQKGLYEGKRINKIDLNSIDYSKLKGKKVFLPLGEKDKLILKKPLHTNLEDNKQYFVTSKYCLSSIKQLTHSIFWASGSRTMKKMAKQGHWLNGSADSLGHCQIQKISESAALNIMIEDREMIVLSHKDANSQVGTIIPCYERVLTNFKQDLSKFEVFYWSSFFQYSSYIVQYPEIKNKIHTCGLGKTFDQFKENNIDVTPFASMAHLKNICNTKGNL